MKIKEFYSSGIKENGKIDISFQCDNKAISIFKL